MKRYVLQIALVITFIGIADWSAANPVTFATRASFLAQVGHIVVDDYSNPGYAKGDITDSSDLDQHSDAHMSAVLGETSYTTTGWLNHDLVFAQSENAKYCAGCNGSFLLRFSNTSVGTSNGVFGVGFNFSNAMSRELYGALVTFGDGSTMSYSLPHAATGLARDTPGFLGIVAPELIYSIHFGPNGGHSTSQGGAFWLDNLTLGAARTPNPVPEPASLFLVATGLGVVLRSRWSR